MTDANGRARMRWIRAYGRIFADSPAQEKY